MTTKSLDQIYQIHLKGEFDRAEGLYLAAPRSSQRDMLLGTMYVQAEQYGRAEKYLRASLDVPKKMAYSNLIMALRKIGNFEEGINVGGEAIDIWGLEDPELCALYSNLASSYIENGELEKAIEILDRSIKAKPDHVDSLWNRGIAKLGLGDWSGWEGFDQGFNAKERGMASVVHEIEDYNGEDLTDKTILVWGEQGLGDEILFAGALNDLKKDAGHVIFECHPRLESLYKRSFPDIEVVGSRKSQNRARWDDRDIDYHSAIGTLQQFYRKKDADFPTKGYLKADSERVQYWKDQFPGQKLVGLSWRGGVQKTGGFKRSMPLTDFMPPSIDRVQYISLQYGNVFEETIDHDLFHDEAAIEDLDDLAALISACDIVVSVIQTNVHLAGALDVPTWCLTPKSAPWKFQRGEKMIWHPSVRQFHQTDSWKEVAQRVHAELTRTLS